MEHQSSLSPIDEDDRDPRGRSAQYEYEDLPTVTPKLRTFQDTTQRQNAEDAILRKQLLQFKQKEEQLQARIQELEELTDTLVDNAGRNPPEKTATPNTAFTPRAAILLDSAPVKSSIGSNKHPNTFAQAPTVTCSPKPQLSALFFVAPLKPYKKALTYLILCAVSSKFQIFEGGMGSATSSRTVWRAS